jgi:hypothetical protein
VTRTKRIVALLVCIGLSAVYSIVVRQHAGKITLMCDFGEIYFGARCALHGQDPYDANALFHEFAVEGGELPSNPARAKMAHSILSLEFYLPVALLLAVPLAVLPWVIAQNVWMLLIAGSLALAAFLVWDLGAEAAPDIWFLLTCFMLVNCEGLLLDGNAAGISVGLCVVASWCFVRRRHQWAGVLLLALALCFKPHDAGFVWLYFLLAGGLFRKRALQTLAVVAILAIAALLWITPTSPHWPQEIHSSLATVTAHGGTFDPGLSGTTNSGAGQIVDLQAVLSIFWDNPAFYNLTTWIVFGVLLLVWALVTILRRPTRNSTLYAFAAISALSMLPVYHRTNDARLLLLAIPACAILWTGRGPVRWIAFGLTSAAIFLTADMPLAILGAFTRDLAISTSTLSGKLKAVLLLRPTSVVIVALGGFYLWIYLREQAPADTLTQTDTEGKPLATHASS